MRPTHHPCYRIPRPNGLSGWVLIGCFSLSAAVGLWLRLVPLRIAVSDDNFEKAVVLLSASRRTSFLKRPTTMPRGDELVRDAIVLGQRWDRRDGRSAKHHLLGADSFHFLERTDRIITQGRISDHIKGGRYFHELMNAPFGYWEPFSLHPYLGAGWHRLLTWLGGSRAPAEDVGWLPLILFGLGLGGFLWTVSALTPQPLGWTAVGLVFACAPIYLKRSAWGWYDTDPYQIVFPVFVMGAWLRMMAVPVLRIRTVLSTTAVMTAGIVLYALFWQGWLSLWAAVAGLGAGCLGTAALVWSRRPAAARELLFIAGTGLFAAVVSILLLIGLWGGSAVWSLCRETLSALGDFVSPSWPLWPPLYNAVGELRPTPWRDLVFYLGGYPMAVFCLVGWFGVVERCRDPSVRLRHKAMWLLLAVWWAVHIVMAKSAQRFLLLALVPSAFLAAEGAGRLAVLVPSTARRMFNTFAGRATDDVASLSRRFLFSVISMTVFILPFFLTLNPSSLISRPYNDTWDRALTILNRMSEPNAIVNTWWPPGHFIKATAHRRVIFDGATINKPRAYWVAQAFTARDEQYAAGVLRMLNNGGNTLPGFIVGMTPLDLPHTVAFIRQWLRLTPSQARARLEALPWPVAVKEILWQTTHRRPVSPVYVIVHNELFEKSIQLYFIAGWDFETARLLHERARSHRPVPSVTGRDFVHLVWRMRAGAVRISPVFSGRISADGRSIAFAHGDLTYRPDTRIMTIASKTYGRGHPHRILTLIDGELDALPQPPPRLPYTAVISPLDGRWECVLMDDEAADSLLTRLYMFNGKGLKRFRHRATVQSAGGRTRIKIFSVDLSSP